MGYEPKTWVSGETIYAVDLNHMELGIEAASKVGTERQVMGFSETSQEPITLGWKHFSDLPNPPSFNSGVLSGTTFTPDGYALFYFQELNSGIDAVAKARTIPMYGTGGVLKVADGIANNDAVSKGQLDAINLSTLSLPAATSLPVIAPDETILNTDKLTAMVAKLYATSQAYSNRVYKGSGGNATLPANARGKVLISLTLDATADFILKLNADLTSNSGLFIVCSNMSPTHNIIIESATGQNSVITDAGNIPESTVTVIPQTSYHFICNGTHVIGC